MYVELFHEHKKRIVNSLFRCAIYSRCNGFAHQEPTDTDAEHWAFQVTDDECQFQAVNCFNCGNYKLSNTLQISRKALCKCK